MAMLIASLIGIILARFVVEWKFREFFATPLAILRRNWAESMAWGVGRRHKWRKVLKT
jgi:uncharacterized membrane protein affecting hemolysin expression